MKVLLIQDVRGIGRRMEIKNVSDGYARNFLFARKLAVPADEKALHLKEEQVRAEETEIAALRTQAQTLKDIILLFPVKIGVKGEVFGSIKSGEIQKALQDKGFSKFEIELLKPIKDTQEHIVPVAFAHGVMGSVKVQLTPIVK